MNEWGCPLAYFVLGNDETGDRFVPAEQMIHIADWEFLDQTRLISVIADGMRFFGLA
jgi:hypothetical protein